MAIVRQYAPQVPPSEDTAEALRDYVVRELERLASHIAAQSLIQLEVLYVEPEKPRVGMIVYADGTEWDPGSGEGAYVYTSGGWSILNV